MSPWLTKSSAEITSTGTIDSVAVRPPARLPMTTTSSEIWTPWGFSSGVVSSSPSFSAGASPVSWASAWSGATQISTAIKPKANSPLLRRMGFILYPP